MDTISPGLEAPLVPRMGIAWRWPRLSRTFWGGVALALLALAVAGWRFAICITSVQACMR